MWSSSLVAGRPQTWSSSASLSRNGACSPPLIQPGAPAAAVSTATTCILLVDGTARGTLRRSSGSTCPPFGRATRTTGSGKSSSASRGRAIEFTPAVLSLNADQILILGGYRDADLNDIVLLNTSTDDETDTTTHTFTRPAEGSLAFSCRGNEISRVAAGAVVLMGRVGDQAAMLKYDCDSHSVSVIRRF